MSVSQTTTIMVAVLGMAATAAETRPTSNIAKVRKLMAFSLFVAYN